MSSLGQRRGACGHTMAIFDQYSYCEKNKGKDPCVENKDTTSCKFCLAFTPEQLAQISTPSYKLKKEKREARKSVTATPTKDCWPARYRYSTRLCKVSIYLFSASGEKSQEGKSFY